MCTGVHGCEFWFWGSISDHKGSWENILVHLLIETVIKLRIRKIIVYFSVHTLVTATWWPWKKMNGSGSKKVAMKMVYRAESEQLQESCRINSAKSEREYERTITNLNIMKHVFKIMWFFAQCYMIQHIILNITEMLISHLKRTCSVWK